MNKTSERVLTAAEDLMPSEDGKIEKGTAMAILFLSVVLTGIYLEVFGRLISDEQLVELEKERNQHRHTLENPPNYPNLDELSQMKLAYREHLAYRYSRAAFTDPKYSKFADLFLEIDYATLERFILKFYGHVTEEITDSQLNHAINRDIKPNDQMNRVRVHELQELAASIQKVIEHEEKRLSYFPFVPQPQEVVYLDPSDPDHPDDITNIVGELEENEGYYLPITWPKTEMEMQRAYLKLERSDLIFQSEKAMMAVARNKENNIVYAWAIPYSLQDQPDQIHGYIVLELDDKLSNWRLSNQFEIDIREDGIGKLMNLFKTEGDFELVRIIPAVVAQRFVGTFGVAGHEDPLNRAQKLAEQSAAWKNEKVLDWIKERTILPQDSTEKPDKYRQVIEVFLASEADISNARVEVSQFLLKSYNPRINRFSDINSIEKIKTQFLVENGDQLPVFDSSDQLGIDCFIDQEGRVYQILAANLLKNEMGTQYLVSAIPLDVIISTYEQNWMESIDDLYRWLVVNDPLAAIEMTIVPSIFNS